MNAQREEAEHGTQVVLLGDEPSESDEFAARAHDRVAKAIVDLVQRESGGQVIGLEGSWGSGKSTVVRLVSQHLSSGHSPDDPPKTHVVIFDAWAHQGDPLRRTFLESLVDDLTAVKWLPKPAAFELRANLAGKKARVRAIATQRLTPEGKAATAAAVLVPLGIVLTENHFHTLHRLALLLGALLTIAPLVVVALFAMACPLGVRLGGKNKHSADWRGTLARVQPFSFFAKEQVTDTTTEHMERGEPTSVEFEQLFSEALERSVKDDRRLLIVLDNLDRVEEDDAKTILATMRTFTGSRTREDSTWEANVWTLIPYDPGGLDRLWKSDAATTNEAVGEEVHDEGVDVETNARPLTTVTATAFVEKIFQIRFEAPPLVLSDWRRYLRRLLREALPQALRDEFGLVIRLYGLYPACASHVIVASQSPTPRQLKQFVNQVGAICRQRDDIPLVTIAYYVLLRQDQTDVANALVDGSLPHTKLGYLFQEDIREELGALHFGAEKNLAQQLLLRGALEAAFAGGNSAIVQELKERPGFLDALDSLDVDSANGGVELTRMAAVLQDSGALEIPDVEAWCRSTLHKLARIDQPWVLDGKDTGVGLATLFDAMTPGDDDDLLELLARIAPETRETDANGELQMEGVAGLADALVRRGRGGPLVRVRINIPAERVAASVALFGKLIQRRESCGILELAAGPAAVAEALVATAAGDGFADVRGAFDVLMSARPERIGLNVLGSGCLTWLVDNEPSSAEHLAALFDIVDRVREEDALDDALGAAADSGTLMHLVAVALTNNWQSEAAAAAMLHLAVRPAFENPQATRQSVLGTQRLRQGLTNPGNEPPLIAAQLEWLKAHQDEAFALLMKIAGGGPFEAWVDIQVAGLFKGSVLETSALEYIAHWEYLRRVLEDDDFTLHTRRVFDDQSKRVSVIQQCDDPALVEVALNALALDPEAAYVAEIWAWANAIVQRATADRWHDALRSSTEDPLVEVALRLAGTPDAPSDPSGLDDAVRSHFQALVASETVWEPDGATFARLAGLLSADTRAVLASAICSQLEGLDGQIPEAIFSTYGDFLAGEKSFRTHKTLPNVVERLVAHDDWDAVEWFVMLAEDHRDAIRKTGRRSEIVNLSRKVSEKLMELGDDAPEPLLKLGAQLQAKGQESK